MCVCMAVHMCARAPAYIARQCVCMCVYVNAYVCVYVWPCTCVHVRLHAYMHPDNTHTQMARQTDADALREGERKRDI